MLMLGPRKHLLSAWLRGPELAPSALPYPHPVHVQDTARVWGIDGVLESGRGQFEGTNKRPTCRSVPGGGNEASPQGCWRAAHSVALPSLLPLHEAHLQTRPGDCTGCTLHRAS